MIRSTYSGRTILGVAVVLRASLISIAIAVSLAGCSNAERDGDSKLNSNVQEPVDVADDAESLREASARSTPGDATPEQSVVDSASGRGGMPNNLAYYATGNASTVDAIEIVLNYNNPATPTEVTSQFIAMAKDLSRKATGSDLPREVEKALREGEPTTLNARGYRHEVKREDWPTGIGYEVHYVARKSA